MVLYTNAVLLLLLLLLLLFNTQHNMYVSLIKEQFYHVYFLCSLFDSYFISNILLKYASGMTLYVHQI